ncbi:hypothetical protein ACFL6E_07635 [Candidatus Neomarinimicrobiota bacterium]
MNQNAESSVKTPIATSISERNLMYYITSPRAIALACMLLIFLFLVTCTPRSNGFEIEYLGQPGLAPPLVLDTALGYNVDGSPSLYTVTYHRGNNEKCFVIEINAVSGELKQETEIPGRIGPYHVTLGSDGRLYAGVYGAGYAEMWSYDPVSGTVRDEGKTIPGESFTFGLNSGLDGKIYGGTNGDGRLFAFDPSSATYDDLGDLVPGNKYVKAILPLSPTQLLVGTGAPAHLVLLDLDTHESRINLLPKAYRDDSFVYNLWQSENFIFVRLAPSGKVLVLERTSFRLHGELPDPAFHGIVALDNDHIWYRRTDNQLVLYDVGGGEILRSLELTGEIISPAVHSISIADTTWITAVSTEGVWWRVNTISGQIISRQLKLPATATTISALALGPGGKIYGGTYETNALFCYDPANQKLENYGNVAPGRTGEILGIAADARQLYTASYIQSVLCKYDPERPWAPGRDPYSNPREIGEIGHEQNRPCDMAVGPNGNVYTVSMAAYGKYSGALAVYDPDSDSLHVYRGLVGQYNLVSMAASEQFVYAGSMRHIEGREPLDGSAEIIAFDIGSRTKSRSIVPLKGANAVQALAVVGNQLYSAVDDQLITIDIDDFRIGKQDSLRIGSFAKGEGYMLFAGGADGIFQIDTQTGEITKLSDTGPGPFYHTLVYDLAKNLYFARGDSLFRMALE